MAIPRRTAVLIPAQGPANVIRLAEVLEDPNFGLLEEVREPGRLLVRQIAGFDERIAGPEKTLCRAVPEDADARRLMTIPGVGPITAMAVHAFAPPMESFRRGRDCSAWLGLVPRQHTTGSAARHGVPTAVAPGRCSAANSRCCRGRIAGKEQPDDGTRRR